MKNITQELHKVLLSVDGSGDFYATGRIDAYPALIEVNKVGRIALPLQPEQMQALIAVSEQAPYGRGSETLVDTNVRKTWQIGAEQIHISGKHWQKTLDTIVSEAAADLGVNIEIKAELYKMLVYDEGSFFVSHRDTEKAPGMFATLVIVLPSNYTGGELIIRHQQQEVSLHLNSQDPSELAYAAFYADCQHEILPITSGCRLALIYNLMRSRANAPLPVPPDFTKETDKAANLLLTWQQQLQTLQKNDQTSDDVPEKLIFSLEHAYSQAELKFSALKNADAALADVLIKACERADCDLHLALLTIEESGSAEHNYDDYYSSRRRRHWDDDEDQNGFTIGEVFDSLEVLSDWRRPDDSVCQIPNLPFSEYEFCPPEAFEAVQPKEVEFQEATGNAGASFERSYHGATLVLWPKQHYLNILCQAEFDHVLPIARDYCLAYQAAGRPEQNSIEWQNAHTVLSRLIKSELATVKPNQARIQLLAECLTAINDAKLATQVWQIITHNDYSGNAAQAVLAITQLLIWPEVLTGLQTLFEKNLRDTEKTWHIPYTACANLLAALAHAHPSQAADLQPAATILYNQLPGDASRFPKLQTWQAERMTLEQQGIIQVLNAFIAINPELAEQAVSYFLAWPITYPIDACLTPVIQALNKTATNTQAAIVRLKQAVINHVQARCALDLTPPADWQRASQLSCRCADCKACSIFLADANEKTWSFKAAESRRKHVEYTISSNACDVNTRTDVSSRPYVLVLTKNQASYERRVQQRQQDLALLTELNNH